MLRRTNSEREPALAIDESVEWRIGAREKRYINVMTFRII